MKYESFKNDCIDKKCNRNTFISKKCEKEYKIKGCYRRYILKIKKDKIKQEEKLFKSLQKQQEDKIKQEEKLFKKQQEDREHYIKEFEEKKRLYLKGELQDLYGFDNQIDKEFLKVYDKVDKRDRFQCVIWNNILTLTEQKYILENFYNEFKFHGKMLEHAHIESRSSNPEKKYDENNIILMSQFFHIRFDNYKNLITGEDCDKDYRENIQKVLKEYVGEK